MNRSIVRFQTPESDLENIDPTPSNHASKLRREWDTPTRVRVKTLYTSGLSRNAILQQTNVPIRTQRLWQRQGDRRPGADRPGAARRLSTTAVRAIIRFISKSWENRQITWQQLANDFGQGCTAKTMKNTLAEWGYHKCKACQATFLSDNNVLDRKAFCDLYRHRPVTWWRSVRFTDEAHFALESRAAAWVIRSDEERYHPTCMQYKKRQRGSQLHAWAMVGYGYKGPLVFFDSNDTSERSDWIYEALSGYTEGPQAVKETLKEEAHLLGDGVPLQCRHRCNDKDTCKHACCKPGSRSLKTAGNITQEQYLTKIFRPYIEEAWQEAKDQHKKFILLEDNDGSHGTKSTTNIVAKYKAIIGIPWFANSPRSPDFNIIENVWRILKQRLKQQLRIEKATSLNHMKEIITRIWDSIDQKEINSLVETMPQRIRDCRRRKGLNTPW